MAIAPSDHIVFRDTKGSPLTSVEGDQNLDFLNRTKADKTYVDTADANGLSYTNLWRSNANAIDNGGMLVGLRPAVTLSGTVNGYGGPDRWFTTNGSAGGSFTQSLASLVYNGKTYFCLKHLVNTGVTDLSSSNYWGGAAQNIPSNKAQSFIGNPIALQFIYSSNVVGKHSVAFRDSTAAYSYVTTINVTQANTPTLYSILIPTPPAGANFGPGDISIGAQLRINGRNNGSFVATTPDAWNTGNVFVVAGVANYGSTNDTFSLTNVKLEAGTANSRFEDFDQAIERVRCAPYFQKQQVNMYGYGAAGVSFGCLFNFPILLRGAPSVVLLTAGSVNNCPNPTITSVNQGYQAVSSFSAAGGANFVNWIYGFSADI